MKNFLFACALVAGTALTTSAQTPMGTPPSTMTPPSGSSPAPKPDATIDTQVNNGSNQANPADKGAMRSNARAMKRKNGKMKMKSQPTSTM